jgi:hypothetical protein
VLGVRCWGTEGREEEGCSVFGYSGYGHIRVDWRDSRSRCAVFGGPMGRMGRMGPMGRASALGCLLICENLWNLWRGDSVFGHIGPGTLSILRCGAWRSKKA